MKYSCNTTQYVWYIVVYYYYQIEWLYYINIQLHVCRFVHFVTEEETPYGIYDRPEIPEKNQQLLAELHENGSAQKNGSRQHNGSISTANHTVQWVAFDSRYLYNSLNKIFVRATCIVKSLKN